LLSPHFLSINNITTVDIGARRRRCYAKWVIHLGGIEEHAVRASFSHHHRQSSMGQQRWLDPHHRP
jgi:hypothetical protein